MPDERYPNSEPEPQENRDAEQLPPGQYMREVRLPDGRQVRVVYFEPLDADKSDPREVGDGESLHKVTLPSLRSIEVVAIDAAKQAEEEEDRAGLSAADYAALKKFREALYHIQPDDF